MALELAVRFDRGNCVLPRNRRACRSAGGLELLQGSVSRRSETARGEPSWRRAPRGHAYLGRGARSDIRVVCVGAGLCVFGSKLGRILQEAARSQLGIGWSNCRGFTVEEMEQIDFEAVDLTEFTENLIDGSHEPSIALPDSGDTGSVMRERIRDFYSKNK